EERAERVAPQVGFPLLVCVVLVAPLPAEVGFVTKAAREKPQELTTAAGGEGAGRYGWAPGSGDFQRGHRSSSCAAHVGIRRVRTHPLPQAPQASICPSALSFDSRGANIRSASTTGVHAA